MPVLLLGPAVLATEPLVITSPPSASTSMIVVGDVVTTPLASTAGHSIQRCPTSRPPVPPKAGAGLAQSTSVIVTVAVSVSSPSEMV